VGVGVLWVVFCAGWLLAVVFGGLWARFWLSLSVQRVVGLSPLWPGRMEQRRKRLVALKGGWTKGLYLQSPSVSHASSSYSHF